MDLLLEAIIFLKPALLEIFSRVTRKMHRNGQVAVVSPEVVKGDRSRLRLSLQLALVISFSLCEYQHEVVSPPSTWGNPVTTDEVLVVGLAC